MLLEETNQFGVRFWVGKLENVTFYYVQFTVVCYVLIQLVPDSFSFYEPMVQFELTSTERMKLVFTKLMMK